MKINEVTEGLLGDIGKNFASSIASKIGASNTAAAIQQTIGQSSLPHAGELSTSIDASTDASKQRVQNVKNRLQQRAQQRNKKKQPVVTPGGLQLVSTNPIHFRYNKIDYILQTDAAGNEKWVNLAGKMVPDETAKFLYRQLNTL